MQNKSHSVMAVTVAGQMPQKGVRFLLQKMLKLKEMIQRINEKCIVCKSIYRIMVIVEFIGSVVIWNRRNIN